MCVCVCNVARVTCAQVSDVLRRMHRRCQAVYMSDDADPLLSSLVVVDCAWFMRAVDAATAEAARSPGALIDAARLVRALFASDNSADAGFQAGKLSSAHRSVVRPKTDVRLV